MKIKALQDFNLGSMADDYKEGDVAEVSAGVGKDLVAAGLAEEAADDADETKPKKGKPGAAREVKPITHAAIETK